MYIVSLDVAFWRKYIKRLWNENLSKREFHINEKSSLRSFIKENPLNNNMLLILYALIKLLLS